MPWCSRFYVFKTLCRVAQWRAGGHAPWATIATRVMSAGAHVHASRHHCTCRGAGMERWQDCSTAVRWCRDLQ